MKTIFFGGKILTMNNQSPVAHALVIENNKILGLGPYDDLMKTYRPDRLVDLQGKTLLPGFNDSHMHLLGFGQSLQLCRLEGTRSIDDLKLKVKRFIQSTNDTWIRGRGWNQDHFLEKRLPTAKDLDQIEAHKPVVLNRACGHILVCNSAALKIAGITSETLQPVGGAFDVDDQGHPNGILRENAMDLVQKHFPDPTEESLSSAILAGAEYALSQGITSVQSDDLCVYPLKFSRLIIETFRKMSLQGRLPVRVNEQALFRTPENLKAFIASGYKTGQGNAFYSDGPLKILADGSLGARTAYLSQPYADAQQETGIPMYEQSVLDDMVMTAQKHGIATAIHAIGDGTIDMALDAIERAQKAFPNPQLRSSIVHFQITRPEHFERMNTLNVLAHIQPIFIDYDMSIVSDRIGEDRMASTYVWRTMLEKGVKMAFGSDCPVEPLDIMPNIYSAVTRKTLSGMPKGGWMPHEKLDVGTVLKAFTLWGAYASCEENIKGSLEPGKLADFALLDKNPYEVDPDDILKINVVETWVDGKKVYQK